MASKFGKDSLNACAPSLKQALVSTCECELSTVEASRGAEEHLTNSYLSEGQLDVADFQSTEGFARTANIE